jgi:HlyD family secretion protein
VPPSDSPTSLADRVQSLRLPQHDERGASHASLLPWLLSLVLAAVVVYLLLMGSPLQPMFSEGADEDSVATSDGKPAAASNVTVTGAQADAAGAGEISLESKGYIIPEQQILVSPQVSGRVVELSFDAGDHVEKDFVLAVLDNTEYLAEYDRLKASLESLLQTLAELEEGNRPDEKEKARAELAEAETNLSQAARDFQRKKELVARKIVSKEDFEAAEALYNSLVKRVEGLAANTRLIEDGARIERKRMAKAQVRQGEAELRRAQWRLDNCVIRAPIRGTILKKNAELGNLVNPVAFNGSFSLCDMADLSKLEVELSIQERDISRVFKGQRCKVRAEAYPKRVYEGVVSRLMPIADRAKGAVPVRVKLTVPADEEGVYLKPEMGATVQFYAETALVRIEPVSAESPLEQSKSGDPESPPADANPPTPPDRASPTDTAIPAEQK